MVIHQSAAEGRVSGENCPPNARNCGQPASGRLISSEEAVLFLQLSTVKMTNRCIDAGCDFTGIPVK